MGMTNREIKSELGFGGVSKLAAGLRVSVPHVSQVLAGKRRSPRVERAVARRIGRDVSDVFPVRQDSAA